MNLEKFLKEVEEIVNIDSGSYDIEGLNKVAEWLVERYEKDGYYVQYTHQGEIQRPHIIATTIDPQKFDEKEKPIDLMFIGHMDTVFPRGTVAERPFRIENGKAYGPGAADMKSGVLLALYVANALREQYPELSIAMVINSDEELGSNDSAEVLKSFSKYVKFGIDMEPGRISGNAVMARKGVCEYTIRIHGIASHAGNAPEKGASAIREMARWIIDAESLNDRERGITINAGVVKGGTTSNVVPEYAEVVLDVRFWNLEDRDELERKFQTFAASPVVENVKVTVEKTSEFPPMKLLPETQRMVDFMLEEAEKLGQSFSFEKSAGGSDASLVAGEGTPIIDACGPCGDYLHNEKEYFVIDTVEERYQTLLATVKRLFDK